MEFKNLSIFLPTIGLVVAVVVCQMSTTLSAVHSLETATLTSSPQQATQPQNKSALAPASNGTLNGVRSSGNGSHSREKRQGGAAIAAAGGRGGGVISTGSGSGAIAAVGGRGGGIISTGGGRGGGVISTVGRHASVGALGSSGGGFGAVDPLRFVLNAVGGR